MLATAEVSPYTFFNQPAFLNTMGFASYHMGGGGEIIVGNYCSIAGGIRTMGERHPIEYVTSSPIHYDRGMPHFTAMIEHFSLNWRKTPPAVQAYGPLPIIEHDVWIGANVTLARGIRIGTGSVIGTGSIVTKDVEPDSISVGNPARPKRMRFHERTVEQLLASRWWEYANVIVATDMTNPERFLGMLEEAKESGRLIPVPAARITRETIKRLVVDSSDSSDPR
jgi:virginiamycin A acetyltransferase